MSREIKFRSWDKEKRIMVRPGSCLWFVEFDGEVAHNEGGLSVDELRYKDVALMQYIGLEDNSGNEYYIGDIARFDNGDTFQLCLEDWLEVFVDWIGEPECEDQARDLYRITNAKIIGNIYESPELLEEK